MEPTSTPATTTSNTSSYFIPGAVILAGLFIGGAIIWNGQHPGSGTQGGQQPPPVGVSDISKVKLEGEPFIGKADAPVTIAFWSDYQCPFCKRFAQETLPTIVQSYVDTGKVKVVFKDFAFLGQYSQIPGRDDSMTAALYARAVWDLYPDKFKAWHDAMFTAQDTENAGWGDEASVKELTGTIAGIDANKVAQAVKTNRTAYKAKIDADKTEATALGISATPSFIIGKQLIAGAYPFASFDTAIKAALK